MESKEERFIRVAEARTNKIIEMVRLLGNCSNKNNYAYKQTDVKKIFDRIEGELEEAMNKFSEVKQSPKSFRLR